MPHFSSVSIIYNPNSTGSGKELAIKFKSRLTKIISPSDIHITPTKHAGHAEQLAYDIAMSEPKPLVISASGDGGYHEIINGLMKAKLEGAKPVAGLLPAGNANDHFHNLHEGDTIEMIRDGKPTKIDLLKIITTVSGQVTQRYAHSYAGIGLTPKAGRKLNKNKLNKINEILIVLKVLLNLKPVRVLVRGKKLSYDSLIFSNIDKMSKVLELSKKAKVDDGKFEVTAFRGRNKLELIKALLKASTIGLKGQHQASRFIFHTTKPTLMQLDGEIIKIDRNSKTTISLEHSVLPCII